MSIDSYNLKMRLLFCILWLGGFALTLAAQEIGPWKEQWVLIEDAASQKQLIRAVEIKSHSTMVTIRTENGSPMGFQSDYLKGSAPAIPKDLTGISMADIQAALDAQIVLAEQAGDMAGPIYDEIARMKQAISVVNQETKEELRPP
jgi:hypothetical protein